MGKIQKAQKTLYKSRCYTVPFYKVRCYTTLLTKPIVTWHSLQSPLLHSVRVLFLLHLILFMYHVFTFKCIHPIIFKTQEYLCLAIFEKPMIRVHGKTILSMEFKSIIKAHDLNPWQFIHPSPILIGNIKAQFLLTTSKPDFYWHYFIKKKKSPRLSTLGKEKISW